MSEPKGSLQRSRLSLNHLEIESWQMMTFAAASAGEAGA